MTYFFQVLKSSQKYGKKKVSPETVPPRYLNKLFIIVMNFLFVPNLPCSFSVIYSLAMKTEDKVDEMLDTVVSYLECLPSKANLRAMVQEHFGELDRRIAGTRSTVESLHQTYSFCMERTNKARQAVTEMREETKLKLRELKRSHRQR